MIAAGFPMTMPEGAGASVCIKILLGDAYAISVACDRVGGEAYSALLRTSVIVQDAQGADVTARFADGAGEVEGLDGDGLLALMNRVAAAAAPAAVAGGKGGGGRPLLVLPEGLPADEVAFLQRVARERVEQLRRHGHTPERDDGYVEGELGKAAAAYLAGGYGGAMLYPWIDAAFRHFGRNRSGVHGEERLKLLAAFLARKPRLDQLAVGMALGLAEAGRRLRAGEG